MNKDYNFEIVRNLTLSDTGRGLFTQPSTARPSPYQLYRNTVIKSFLIGLANWALFYSHKIVFTRSGQI